MTKNTTSTKKLKIAFVLDDGFDSIDGVQRNILSLGEWLEKNGHSVKYLVGQTKRTDIKNIIVLSKNLRVRYNGNVLSISLYSSKKKIKEVLSKEKFDVIHVQMPYSPFMGARVISQAYKDSLIAGTFHILPYRKFHNIGNHLLGIWLSKNIKKIDLRYSVSKPAAEFAKKTHNFDSQILSNPVDIDHFSRPMKSSVDKNVKNIVFLGRLVPRKGCMELLKAFKILKQDNLVNDDFTLHICGKGYQEYDLKKYAEANNLSANIVFHGFVSEEQKIGFLQNADVAIFPSNRGESFGIVLIEAMAAKAKVVLAADNDGYKSVMGDIDEAIFDPYSSKTLANLIAKYLNSDDLSNQLHLKQQDLVKKFDINLVGKKLVDDYYGYIDKKFS